MIPLYIILIETPPEVIEIIKAFCSLPALTANIFASSCRLARHFRRLQRHASISHRFKILMSDDYSMEDIESIYSRTISHIIFYERPTS